MKTANDGDKSIYLPHTHVQLRLGGEPDDLLNHSSQIFSIYIPTLSAAWGGKGRGGCPRGYGRITNDKKWLANILIWIQITGTTRCGNYQYSHNLNIYLPSSLMSTHRYPIQIISGWENEPDSDERMGIRSNGYENNQ